jgi:hypothetical protein
LEPGSFLPPTSLPKLLASPVTNAENPDMSVRTAHSIGVVSATTINPVTLLIISLTTKTALLTWDHPLTMNPMVTTKAFMSTENSSC